MDGWQHRNKKKSRQSLHIAPHCAAIPSRWYKFCGSHIFTTLEPQTQVSITMETIQPKIHKQLYEPFRAAKGCQRVGVYFEKSPNVRP